MFSDLSRFKGLLILFTAVLFVVILVVSVWMADSVSRPIIRLAATMRIMEAEGFTKTKLQAKSCSRRDEIGTLYQEFAVMLDRIESRCPTCRAGTGRLSPAFATLSTSM